jgi:hypothetical protein
MEKDMGTRARAKALAKATSTLRAADMSTSMKARMVKERDTRVRATNTVTPTREKDITLVSQALHQARLQQLLASQAESLLALLVQVAQQDRTQIPRLRPHIRALHRLRDSLPSHKVPLVHRLQTPVSQALTRLLGQKTPQAPKASTAT